VPDRQTCVDCHKQSPETETDYTLISAQFGWRLTRGKAADGSLVIEWRCPSCWREYKRARGAPASAESGASLSPQPPSSGVKTTGSGRPLSSAAPKSDVDAAAPSEPARPRRPIR